MLSCTLQIRLSSMIKTVERAIWPLSDDDQKHLMTYVHAAEEEERESIRKDTNSRSLLRNLQNTRLDETDCDISMGRVASIFHSSRAQLGRPSFLRSFCPHKDP